MYPYTNKQQEKKVHQELYCNERGIETEMKTKATTLHTALLTKHYVQSKKRKQ